MFCSCYLTHFLLFSQESKVGLSPSKKNIFVCFTESSLKMMKNVFYFMLINLFVLEMFHLCLDFLIM